MCMWDCVWSWVSCFTWFSLLWNSSGVGQPVSRNLILLQYREETRNERVRGRSWETEPSKHSAYQQATECFFFDIIVSLFANSSDSSCRYFKLSFSPRCNCMLCEKLSNVASHSINYCSVRQALCPFNHKLWWGVEICCCCYLYHDEAARQHLILH